MSEGTNSESRSDRRRCFRCLGVRLVEVSAPVSRNADHEHPEPLRLSIQLMERASKTLYLDSVPHEFGIGYLSFINFIFCLDCGQIQGTWPKPKTELDSVKD